MNVFTFSGNCGAACETRFTANGTAIGTFNVAVKSGYGDHEKTSWIICKLWGKRAESLGQYINKGDRVFISGEFTNEEWTDKDGNKRYTPSVNISDIDLAPKSDRQPQPEPPSYGGTGGDTGGDVPFMPIY